MKQNSSILSFSVLTDKKPTYLDFKFNMSISTYQEFQLIISSRSPFVHHNKIYVEGTIRKFFFAYMIVASYIHSVNT